MSHDRHRSFFGLGAALCALAVDVMVMPARAQDDFAAAGAQQVKVYDLTWTDHARNREVPVRIYIPDGAGPCPVIIFSHGLGGSREGYAYLGQQWASHGFISVHVTHHGSDTDVFTQAGPGIKAKMDAFRAVIANPDNRTNRPKDISFAIDQVIACNTQDCPLKGRVDPNAIGIAGHSFGGFTAMAIAGEAFPNGVNYGDPRVKAVVAMSAPANHVTATEYDGINIPVLLMTGTLDDSAMLGGTAEQRMQIFDALTNTERFMCIFTGGDHMTFATDGAGASRLAMAGLPGMKGDRANDPKFQTFIKTSTTAFFDAYLRHDPTAKQWLEQAAAKTLGDEGTWKRAVPTAQPAK